MTKFKTKNGICEVFSKENIDKLRKDKSYQEIVETKNKEVTTESKPLETENKEKKSK